VFSDPICWNKEKEKTKTKKMMGWIENGPQKKWRRFFVRQQLPAKTEKVPFRFYHGFREVCQNIITKWTCQFMDLTDKAMIVVSSLGF
jgi:hypothetical protein